MMGIRATILWIWQLVDPIFYFFSRLHYIQLNHNKRAVFRVRVTKYKGVNVILSDGTSINKNDFLLKIHLHNVRLLNEFRKVKSELQRARFMYKSVLGSMPALANYLHEHPSEVKIKGIIGITTINKVVELMGFECFAPTNGLYSRMKKMGQLPIFLLTNFSIKEFKRNKLNYLIMSKEILYERYGQKPASK